MTGPVALHGGGEYVTGDEAAMDALLTAAIAAARSRQGEPQPGAGRRDPTPLIVLLPTAAARQRPELAVAHGERAFRAAAARAGVAVRVRTAMVADASSAGDPARAALLASADLVHLPGGDPDLIPAILSASPAWAGVLAARAHGAVVAGASAGAMALCDWLLTRGGGVRGLGLVPGTAVLPHFELGRLAAWSGALDAAGAPPLAWVGLDERTLVIGRSGLGAWRVEGSGRAHLVRPGRSTPDWSAGAGEAFPDPATSRP